MVTAIPLPKLVLYYMATRLLFNYDTLFWFVELLYRVSFSLCIDLLGVTRQVCFGKGGKAGKVSASTPSPTKVGLSPFLGRTSTVQSRVLTNLG